MHRDRESALIGRDEKGQHEITNEDPKIVILKVGRNGTSYLLDRYFLRMTSAEFDKLLSTNKMCYKIPDVEPNVFQEIVRHIYVISEWKFNGNLVEACDLIRAAGNYGLNAFCLFVLDRISALPFDGLVRNSSACYALDVVQNLKCYNGDFAERILYYICKNAKAIFSADYFLDLSCEALVKILREDNLEIDCELDVFKVVLRWGVHNLLKISKIWSVRTLREILEVPFQHIRFCNMTAFELQNYVRPLGILTPELQKVVDEAYRTAENQFDQPEIAIIDDEDITRLKPLRKYSSVPSQPEQCKETMEEISRAELFVIKYKFQEIAGELREDCSLKDVAYKEELLQVKSAVQEEIRKSLEVNLALKTQISKMKQEMDALQRDTRRDCPKTFEKSNSFHETLEDEPEVIYLPSSPENRNNDQDIPNIVPDDQPFNEQELISLGLLNMKIVACANSQAILAVGPDSTKDEMKAQIQLQIEQITEQTKDVSYGVTKVLDWPDFEYRNAQLGKDQTLEDNIATFRCNFCVKDINGQKCVTAASFYSYKKHALENHVIVKTMWDCPQCPKRFLTRAKLRSHINGNRADCNKAPALEFGDYQASVARILQVYELSSSKITHLDQYKQYLDEMDTPPMVEEDYWRTLTMKKTIEIFKPAFQDDDEVVKVASNHEIVESEKEDQTPRQGPSRKRKATATIKFDRSGLKRKCSPPSDSCSSASSSPGRRGSGRP